MDYSGIRILQMMQVKMAYLSEKQDALAQNVANADTPGYKAKKMKDLDFDHLAMAESRRLQMRGTSAGSSMEGTRPTQQFRQEKQRKTFETTPVKNNVALEEQMAMVAQNNLDYTTVTNLYTKTTGMFKIALGQGNN